MDSRPNPLRSAVPWVLVGIAVAFNVCAYLGELTLYAPSHNDHVLHFGAISRANEVWQAGGNPRDPWIPYWSEGFPLLRYYQHLSHLAVVFVFRALRGIAPLHTVFKTINFAMLVGAPLSFFLGARLLGFGRLAAGFVALCLPLLGVSAGGRHFNGFQAASYLWYGNGMFPQLAGMVLFAPAVGSLHRAVLTRRHYGVALLLLSCTWLCHMLLGYMACALGCLALFRPEAGRQRGRVALGLAALYAATSVVSAYLILPSLLESHLLHRSTFEAAEYWDSFGMGRIVPWLLRGDLLDGARLPVLTVLSLGGLALAFVRSTERVATSGAIRTALLAFAMSLLIYFGRPTWGSLLVLMPFSGDFPLHRWLCVVQFAALLLCGLCLGWLWEMLRWDSSRLRLAAASAVALVLVAPGYFSKWQTTRAGQWTLWYASFDYWIGGRGIHELLWDIHQHDVEDPGRGYAGRPWNWGKRFTLGDAPVYMLWSGADISAVAEPFQMSLNIDVESGSFRSSRLDHHELFNVRYLLHNDAAQLPPFATGYWARSGIVAARVSTPGYFDVVGADLVYRASRSNPKGLQELAREFVEGKLHARGRFVRVTFEDADESAGREVADPAELRQLEAEPWQRPRGAVHKAWGHNDWFTAQVRVEDPAYVLFRMSYHPNWRATVDGAPAETVMLSPSFIGIPVSPGETLVEMRYVPGSWTSVLFYVGLVVPALGLLKDRLDAWEKNGSPGPSRRRRVLREGLALLAAFLLLRTLVNLPIPEERMPHSSAAHARELEYFRANSE